MLHEAELYNVVVWAIFSGIVFSIFYISQQKKSIGTFITKLIDNKSFTPENSKSLEELGITGKFCKTFIYSGVKSQHGLVRIVGFVNKSSHKAPTEFADFLPDDTTRFYIDENSANDAKRKYNINKTNKLYMTICIVVLLIIACVASTVISKLTKYAGSVFSGYGSYKPQEEEVQKNEDKETPDETEENSDGALQDKESLTNEENTDISDIEEELLNSEPEDTKQDDTPIRPTIPKGPLS